MADQQISDEHRLFLQILMSKRCLQDADLRRVVDQVIPLGAFVGKQQSKKIICLTLILLLFR
jgi:hypothetical protein